MSEKPQTPKNLNSTKERYDLLDGSAACASEAANEPSGRLLSFRKPGPAEDQPEIAGVLFGFYITFWSI